MASYTFSRTGAEIEGILDHAANQWTVIEDVTLSAAESAHEKTGISCSEIVVMVAGFSPTSAGENMTLTINGTNVLAVWHNAPQVNSAYKIRALPVSTGCYIDSMGGASQWQNFSPLYFSAIQDASHSKIESVKLSAASGSFPTGCKITIIGRA